MTISKKRPEKMSTLEGTKKNWGSIRHHPPPPRYIFKKETGRAKEKTTFSVLNVKQ